MSDKIRSQCDQVLTCLWSSFRVAFQVISFFRRLALFTWQIKNPAPVEDVVNAQEQRERQRVVSASAWAGSRAACARRHRSLAIFPMIFIARFSYRVIKICSRCCFLRLTISRSVHLTVILTLHLMNLFFSAFLYVYITLWFFLSMFSDNYLHPYEIQCKWDTSMERFVWSKLKTEVILMLSFIHKR